MRQIGLGVIGTGWCGAIRARTAASSPLVGAGNLHLAEIRPDRLVEIAAQTGAATATGDHRELLANPAIDAVVISTTPETTHHPIALAALRAGKHVLLEKPLALTLDEADQLIEEAERRNLRFTVGYSQRFNPKQALIRRSLADGTLGEPVSVLISRHITRRLGDKIGSRIKLSPAAMEATHDIDFALWCLEPARPVRIYAQAAGRVMRPRHGVDDYVSMVVTMDDGTVVTIAAGWILPPAYPNFSTTWIEVVGTEGALFADDSHRDTVLSTMADGTMFPLSTMPGEAVGHVYAGPMERETAHFLEAVALDRDVLVTPAQACLAMEVYLAADRSAERGEPVSLSPSGVRPRSSTAAAAGPRTSRDALAAPGS